MNTEDEKKQERKDHRKRNRLRNKRKVHRLVHEVLGRFLDSLKQQMHVGICKDDCHLTDVVELRDLYQRHTTLDTRFSIDWNSFPADADPVTRIGILKKTAKARGQRKRKQIESIYDVLRSHALLDVDSEKRQTIVDFGCGTGNLILALAHLFPEHDFVGVDLKETSIRLLNERIDKAQLTNVRTKLSLIENFDEEFDIGLALHVCGNATDAVLSICVEKNKSFICVPCCVGKIQVNRHCSLDDMRKRLSPSADQDTVGEVDMVSEEGETSPETTRDTLRYPRSALMRSICDENTFMSVAKLADWSGNQEVSAYEDSSDAILPTQAKEAVEIDRAQRCKEEGYEGSISLIKLHDCGLRNDLILGVIDLGKSDDCIRL